MTHLYIAPPNFAAYKTQFLSANLGKTRFLSVKIQLMSHKLWLIIDESSFKTIKSKRKKQLDLADYAKQIPGVDASQINAAPIENV